MTKLFEQAVAAVEKLPAVEQDRWASLLLAEVEDDRLWGDALARNPGKLARIVGEGIADIEAGRT